ncbi:hypothetical protein KQI65_15735 [bacterium]|nr:hypothetical protein [bacterium]
MDQKNVFRKYQVYFFLYLAVICELLIIIVERDDAELRLRQERDQLLELTQKIVLELMETTPVQSLNGSNQMEVGETRRFVIMLQGMGPEDQVTIPPQIVVRKNGNAVQTLKLGRDILPVSEESQNGKRVFAFNWRAPAPGEYSFEGKSSINRIGILPTGEVKLASLSFPYELIASLVPDLPERIDQFENLEAGLRVKVLAKGDQLELHGGSLVTAAGYADQRYIEVQGTDARRVRAAANFGEVKQEGERLRWTHTFAKADKYNVEVQAVDTRGAGALSHSKTCFVADVKWPVSKSTVSDAFAGELFRKNIMVDGLEVQSDYSWRARLDGTVIGEGRGGMAEIPLDESAAGKTLTLEAQYRGKSYPIALDENTLGDSRFRYSVLEAPARIRNISFSRGGEYAITQEFRFDAFVCGSCIKGNYRPADRIRVEVESEYGRDLLDDYILEPVTDSNGAQIGTRVKIYLRGKVDRDGEEALFILRAGNATERVPVVLYPD